MSVECRTTPLAGRGERDELVDGPVVGCGVLPHDRLLTGVGSWLGGGDGAERLLGPVAAISHRHERGHLHDGFGQRARLVQADDVDPGEPLDSRQFLHQDVVASQPHDAHCERDAGQQDEPLGHHGDEPGDRAADGLRHPVGDPELVDEQADAHRDHEDRHHGDDPVDAGPQFRTGEGELLRLLGQLGRVGLATDPGRPVGAGAGDDETARHHGIPRRLDDRVGLPRQQRLVDFQAGGAQRGAVHDDLVAAGQVQHVVLDDLIGAHLGHDAVPVGAGGRFADDGEPVKGALGPLLLHDADQGVGDDDEPEQRIVVRPDPQNRDEQRAEQAVERGEDVGPDDVGGAAARPARDVVDEPLPDPVRYLRRRQPGDGCRRQGWSVRPGGRHGHHHRAAIDKPHCQPPVRSVQSVLFPARKGRPRHGVPTATGLVAGIGVTPDPVRTGVWGQRSPCLCGGLGFDQGAPSRVFRPTPTSSPQPRPEMMARPSKEEPGERVAVAIRRLRSQC